MHQNFYNKQLRGFARNFRKDSTHSEIHLWTNILKNKQTGYTFLRQRSIDNFIADFMCRALKLIIEVDGYSHNFKYEEDVERDRKLLELGYKTIRFHDDEVMHDLENVERAIMHEIKEREKELQLF
jgi:very-short-patch-repair endonuclease